MKKILILLTVMMTTVIGAYTIDLNEIKWLQPKGQNKQNQYKVTGNQVDFKLIVPEKASAWFIAVPQKELNLTGQNFFEFSAKTNDGKTQLVYFYVRRELAENDYSSYYSIIEVTPEWKTFHLRLERSSRTQASQGFFVFAKGAKNCDIDLKKGGKLLSFQAVLQSNADISFKDLKLAKEISDNDPRAMAVQKQIMEHAKFKPYTFAQVIKPNAVKAAGFTIVTANPENFAARELSRYLEKVTGSKFPVSGKAAGKNIRLEVTPAKPADGFKAELLDEKNLTITANSERGLLFAVYDFLEKAAGIRWFAPFEYGEVIPVNLDLSFPLFKDNNDPVMIYRCPHYCSYTRSPEAEKYTYEMADWAFKNRFNVELERLKNRDKVKNFYAERGGCIWLMENAGHNFHKLISPKKYFQSNPEFFCYDRATGKWKANYAQLCTTNQELVKELGRIADDYFQRNPEQEYFPLFQEDGSRLWCQCPSCLALNPSGSNLGNASENNINLANNVCREIQKKYPGKGITTYAYGITVRPPGKILPVPGVRIMYCYGSDNDPSKMPWDSSSFQNVLEWSRLTKGNMLIYSYHYLNPRYAYNNEHVLINMFRFFSIMNIRGSNQESSESWGGVDAYLLYMGGRLSWNPWFDEEAMKKDYFNKFYGAGGNDVRKFHDLLSENICDKSKWKRMGVNLYSCIPESELAKMAEYLKSATNAVSGDQRAGKAVQAQMEYWKYLKAYSKALTIGDDYFRNPDPEKYRMAMEAVAEARAVSKTLIPARLVSFYLQRIYDAWERGLKAANQENLALKNVLEEYNKIKIITENWKFKTDPDVKGDKEQWFAADFTDSEWAEIKSGKFWEDQGYPDYDGTAWYRINIEVPSGKPSALYFGGADERAWVYLDGKYIGGHHEGDVGVLWNEPFVISIPKGTTAGKRQLTIKIIDSAGKGGLWKDVLILQKK